VPCAPNDERASLPPSLRVPLSHRECRGTQTKSDQETPAPSTGAWRNGVVVNPSWCASSKAHLALGAVPQSTTTPALSSSTTSETDAPVPRAQAGMSPPRSAMGLPVVGPPDQPMRQGTTHTAAVGGHSPGRGCFWRQRRRWALGIPRWRRALVAWVLEKRRGGAPAKGLASAGCAAAGFSQLARPLPDRPQPHLNRPPSPPNRAPPLPNPAPQPPNRAPPPPPIRPHAGCRGR